MAGIDHTLLVTEAVNAVIGKPVAYVLETLGLPYPHQTPVPNHVVVAGIIVGGLLLFASVLRKRLKEVPDHWMQHIAELFMSTIHKLVDDVIGPKGRRYQALIATLALFILLSNYSGLLPLLSAPTASPNTTLALSLTVFVYYHWQGVKTQGVLQYLRHFAGPKLPAWLIPLNILFFLIEILSHTSRVLSLAVRLFGNIFGEDVVLIILFALMPYLAPAPMMAFGLFTGLLQTFIFVMLTMMYLAGAVAVEEHH
jgi:F-type H+-transporting ATPase subunit a